MKKELQSTLFEENRLGGDINVFDAVQKDVWQLMQLDSYPKFIKSQSYSNYKKGTLIFDLLLFITIIHLDTYTHKIHILYTILKYN